MENPSFVSSVYTTFLGPYPIACLLILFIPWLIWWGLLAKSSCTSFFVFSLLSRRRIKGKLLAREVPQRKKKRNEAQLMNLTRYKKVPASSSLLQWNYCSVLATMPYCKAGLHWMLLCTLEEGLTGSSRSTLEYFWDFYDPVKYDVMVYTLVQTSRREKEKL